VKQLKLWHPQSPGYILKQVKDQIRTKVRTYSCRAANTDSRQLPRSVCSSGFERISENKIITSGCLEPYKTWSFSSDANFGLSPRLDWPAPRLRSRSDQRNSTYRRHIYLHSMGRRDTIERGGEIQSHISELSERFINLEGSCQPGLRLRSFCGGQHVCLRLAY
jgi:hypothetical protein